MRPDQKQRLETLTEKLIDVFLVEADPDVWAGADVPPQERTAKHRGDRAWDLKGVNALANVVRRTMDIIEDQEYRRPGDGSDDPREDDALERRIRIAEDRAAAAVKRAMQKASQKA